MDKYEVISRIGEGAHGSVLKARSIERNELVALKRIRLQSSSDHTTSTTMIYREIRVLQELTHTNIIAWYDAFLSPDATTIIAVFEYMPSDLSEMMRLCRYQLPICVVRSLTKQLFTGLAYMHSCNIMHRDLKPSNLLISHKNELKIGDFGQACLIDATGKYDHQVATRRYRAIELLLGSQTYGFGVDLWAVGCIIAEMIYGHPIFPGESDIEQIFCIINVLGTPTSDELHRLQLLPDYGKLVINYQDGKQWSDILSEADESAISLISSLLKYDDMKRMSAIDALIHPFINDTSIVNCCNNHDDLSTTNFNFDFNVSDDVNMFYPSVEHILSNLFSHQ